MCNAGQVVDCFFPYYGLAFYLNPLESHTCYYPETPFYKSCPTCHINGFATSKDNLRVSPHAQKKQLTEIALQEEEGVVEEEEQVV